MSDLLQITPPFLLIDKLISIEPGKQAAAIKNVSLNDPFMMSQPIDTAKMSGALIVEAMIQTATATMVSQGDLSGQSASCHEIKKVNFLRDVVPGDQLRIEIEIEKHKSQIVTFAGKTLVNDHIVCEGTIGFKLTEAPSKAQIHPTASVHPSAILGKDVTVGPYSIIKDHVYIGDGTTIEAHVLIEKWTHIGENNHIHFGSVIGSAAQDIKYTGEKAWVVIGDNNEIREYVTINRATGKNEITQIGSGNMFLTNVHIGHNCKVGSNTMLANMVHVGGHCIVEDGAIIGGLTGIHQFVRVGTKTMSGGYSRITQDVPPYTLCDGNPAYVRNLNVVGLRRSGVSSTTLKELKTIYKTIYRSKLNLKQAIAEIPTPISEEAQTLMKFLTSDTSRGISKKTALETPDDE